VLSLSLATSFAILIDFVNNFEGIIVAVFFLTAAVVAASREDLKELSAARWVFVILILVVTALIVGISFSFQQLAGIIFIPLSILDILFLIGYSVMRRTSKHELEFKRQGYR
jgi:ABC-type xylose transport system permease subunit